MTLLLGLAVVFFPNLVFKQVKESTNQSATSLKLAFLSLSLIALSVVIEIHARTPFSNAAILTILALWLVNLVVGRRFYLNAGLCPLGKPAAVQKKDAHNDSLKQVKATLQRMDQTLKNGAVPAAELKALAALRSEIVTADKDVTVVGALDLIVAGGALWIIEQIGNLNIQDELNECGL